MSLRRLSLLWSWDENDDEQPLSTQYSTPRAPEPNHISSRPIEVIDLVSPDVSPQGLKQISYTPRTLNNENQQRLSILPYFPSNEQDLLFANVPPRQLSIEQMACRFRCRNLTTFTMSRESTNENSFIRQKYNHFFGSLVERLHVDTGILDYNYLRLKHVLQLFAESRIRILNAPRSNISQWLLKEDEYPILLEFYLQMDVDLFYMKTCSFRDAQPRSTTEGLFCSQSPQSHYKMTACGHCDLCRSSTAPFNVNSEQAPKVQFNQYERHRFVNGYESILNCPVNCSTKNIIYALTCPCGQFDYIGESSQTLSQCLRRHRQFGHRLIHDFLLGEQNRQRAQGIQQNSEMASKSRMRLYQHSIRCSTAMRLFLDWNSKYLCFVPLLKEDALRQDRYTIGNPMNNNNRSIQERLKYVPVPPDGYQFSRRQLIKQYEFFLNQIDQQGPDPILNLYHGKIIAALPLESSELFRQVVHALFVTHTESKLNTMGHLFDSNVQTSIHNGIWCEHLIRPRQQSSVISSSRYS